MAMASALRLLGKGKPKHYEFAAARLISFSWMKFASADKELIEKTREEIDDEIGKVLSIDKVCPYLSQISERFFDAKDYTTLNNYLQDLRRFNLENKDAPIIYQLDNSYGLKYPSGLECFNYDHAFPPEVRDEIALEVAPLIVGRYKKDQSIKCGKDLNMEFVRVVEESKTDDWFIHRAVVEATNPFAHDDAAAAAAGLPTTPTIKLEATYHANRRNPHTPKLILEAQTKREAEMDNVTASTQEGCDPIWVDTKRHTDAKLDDEAEVKSKELKCLHDKEVVTEGVYNYNEMQAYEKGLGKGHPLFWKVARKTKGAEMQPAFEQYQLDHSLLWDKIKFLEEENSKMQKKLQVVMEENSKMQKKLQLVMDKLQLTA